MTRKCKVYSYLLSTVAPAVIAAASMATTSPALAQCAGPGTKTSQGGTPQTTCVAAIPIPGNPLRSFDISWVADDLGYYMLGDRSNAGIDLIHIGNTAFVGTYSGPAAGSGCTEPPPAPPGTACKFAGVLPGGTNPVNNNISGPDGVTSHGIWIYAGDGNSTLKVIDLRQTPPNGIVQSISTGGTTRVDEMALTLDGTLLLAANNAEDPPFATLFHANGDSMGPSNVTKQIKVTVDPFFIPSGFGLSLEQPTWEPTTQRFYTSIPIIANNPLSPPCNFNASAGPISCDGGLLVFDPNNLTASQCNAGLLPNVCQLGAFNTTTKTGVMRLFPATRDATFQTMPPTGGCGPNGITVGPDANLLLGCTPGNNPFDRSTEVINANTRNFQDIANITGSDEVWFNPSIYAPSGFIGDNRYYLGASKSYTTTPVCFPDTQPNAPKFCAVLGVVNSTGLLIETIPQGSGSHSVAASAARNLIYVPQVAPASVVGPGGDTTTVGQQLCGGTNGCIVVYESPVH